MRIGKLQTAIDVLLKTGITPLLIGHAGIGKTESVRQYAEKNNFNLVELRLGQLADAGDIIGLAEISENKRKERFTQFIMPKIFSQVLDDERPFILFLDEFNRAPKDIIQSIFELVYDGTISSNGFSLKGRGHVITAQNPDIDGYDVLSFKDNAFASRFCQIKVEANTQDWLTYAKKAKINSDVIRYIEADPSSLNQSKDEFAIHTNYNSRSWTRVGMLQEICKDQDLLSELVEGIIGAEKTAAYFSFLEKNKVITSDDVLKNFPKFEKELREMAVVNEKDSQLDTLVNINSGLFATLKTINDEHDAKGDNENSPLTETERDNLCAYLSILPGDMLFMVYEHLLAYRHIMSPPNSLTYEEGKVIRGYPMTDDRISEVMLKNLNVTKEFILNYKF